MTLQESHMRYEEMIKRILAVGIGGFFIVRPLFMSGFAVYPIVALWDDIVHYDVDSNFAIIAGVILDLAHFTLGMLVVSLGFESMKKVRVPTAILTAILAAMIVSGAGIITF